MTTPPVRSGSLEVAGGGEFRSRRSLNQLHFYAILGTGFVPDVHSNMPLIVAYHSMQRGTDAVIFRDENEGGLARRGLRG